MGEALQNYKLLSIFKKQVDCCKKMFKESKKSETQPKMKEMIKQTIKNNNKQQDNANPTPWEMNMIQVDCCKEVFT